MDTGYVNHDEVSPATAFWAYQHEDPRFYMNRIGPMHYSGVGHGHSPIFPAPFPVSTHLGGYMTHLYQPYSLGAMMNATDLMPFGQQFNYIQQPLFYGDFIRFEDNMPIAYRTQAGLPNKNEIRLSNMGSSHTSGLKIHNEKNYSQRQNGYKNKVRTSATKSFEVSPTVRASGSTHGGRQSGQLTQAQLSNAARSSKGSAPPAKRSGIQKTSAPRQVWREKIKAQPSASASQSKSSSKHATPTYHITWNGFDELCEPVGQNCHLCEEDLSYVLTDDESEYYDVFDPPNLPDVAVLPCGHAFHVKCLQLIIPEEQSSDHPCYLCSKF
uniref:RING-type domain-containing protein n=1 Tax=Davidia involucrata TaxID=16924 RepID=A0A5B7BCX8_DAVIN